MALQLDIQTVHGLTAARAYHNIKTYMGTGLEIVVTLRSYVSEEAYRQGAQPVKVQDFQFVYKLNGPNVFVQGYDYLKTLGEFELAIDC
jgi:hypothetical protein